MAISSGNITAEMIQHYIDEQEGEPIEDNQFLIDSTL
jgi:putative transposase